MLQSSPAISNMHISNLFSSPAGLNNCSNSNCNNSWEVLKEGMPDYLKEDISAEI